ncbi:MAG: hypothetical protein O9327_10990 [Polaromonas sp.]|nr:hypothetical protein [Polaromonas sp.]
MNDIGRVQWLYHHLESGCAADLDVGLEPFVEQRNGERILSAVGLNALQTALTDHLFGKWRKSTTHGVSLANWCTSMPGGPRVDLLRIVVAMPWAVGPEGPACDLGKLDQLCRWAKVGEDGKKSWRATDDVDRDERLQMERPTDAGVRSLLMSIAADSTSYVGSKTETLEDTLRLIAKAYVEACPDTGARSFLAPFLNTPGGGEQRDALRALASYVAMQEVAMLTGHNGVVMERNQPPRRRTLAL